MNWKKILLWLGVAVVTVLLLMAGVRSLFGFGDGDISETEPFITANPVDLEQIAAFSPFRSCVGHDFSGKNVDGAEEQNRSMKHYVDVVEPLAFNTDAQVKALAPFDGTITLIQQDEGGDHTPRGYTFWIDTDTAPDWKFEYQHVDPLETIAEGDEVTAGQLIGYGHVQDSPNFDIVLRYWEFGGQRFDSIFNWMTPKVLAEYAAAGVTPENVIVSETERDAKPCTFGPGSGQDEIIELTNQF